jgi:hypothetical protein
LKRQLQELFRELGKMFYEFFPLKGNEDFKNNPRIKTITQKIRRLKNEIRKKEIEYRTIGQRSKSAKGG